MRFRGSAAAAVALVLTLAVPTARAGELEKGTVELSPSLAFSHVGYSYQGVTELSITTATAYAAVGYCVSNRFEIVGGLAVIHLKLSEPGFPSASSTSIGVTGGARVNFATAGNIVPFVGAQLGVLTNPDGGDPAAGKISLRAPILEGGIRVLVGSSASVNFGVGYEHLSNALGLQDVSANLVSFGIGVSIFPVVGK